MRHATEHTAAQSGPGLPLPVAALVCVVLSGAALVVASWWGYLAVGWVNANVQAPAVFFWFVYAQIATDVLTLTTWIIKGVMRVFPQGAAE